MATINFKVIRQQTAKQAHKTIVSRADRALNNKFEKNKENFLREIEDDQVSQELAAGNSAPNLSLTLGGNGNLFSFLGFSEGDAPIENLINYLRSAIRKTESKIASVGTDITIRSSVIIPSAEELESLNGPGEPAHITDDYPNSGWIRAVRRGQGGYTRYLYDVIREFRTSRSGTAIQIKGLVRQGSMLPKTSFFTKQVANFRKNLNKR